MSNLKSTLLSLVICFVTFSKMSARSDSNLLKNTCDRKWELIFAHDENGTVTFGSKPELLKIAMTGNYVKANLYLPDSILQIPSGASDIRGDAGGSGGGLGGSGGQFGQTAVHILQLPADNINKRGDELCFQSLRALSHNGSHVDSVDPWLFYMVCTTGHVTERDVTSSTVYRVAIDWYVKDICSDHKPVYSNYLDGSASHKSRIEKLHEAARQMGLVGAMRDKPYVFPLDNVMLDPETGEVNGQNVNHIGQQQEQCRLSRGGHSTATNKIMCAKCLPQGHVIMVPAAGGGRLNSGDAFFRYVENYITFHQIPYWWFSHWSNVGQRDNARWAVQGTVPYIHNADSAAVDWYADICWRWVFANDDAGTDIFGSVDELISYIDKGHRVRVRFDDVNYEVSNVRVKNRVVSAQITHEVSKVGGNGRDRYFIEPATRTKFSIVHTTGKVNSYSYIVGQATQEVIPAVRKTMEWMVDTRPWNPVLETTTGTAVEVSRGSLHQLRDAAMGGASIRLKIMADPADGAFYIKANNIRVDYLTDTVYAQALDYISDKISRIPNEYELQASVYNIYYTVSSDGVVRMTSWYRGTDTFRAEETLPTATVTWFANE